MESTSTSPSVTLRRVAKRLRARQRAIRAVIRFFAALTLAFFVMQSSVAWALTSLDRSSCCDGEGGDDERDERTCPCPLDCSTGCAGSSVRALPAASVDLSSSLLPAIVIVDDLPPAAPVSTDPLDILHVPKR